MSGERLRSQPVYIDETLPNCPIVTQHPELKRGEYLKILVPHEQLLERVDVIGGEILADYQLRGQDWIVIPVFKGARFFIERLSSTWPQDLVAKIDYAEAESRHGMTQAKVLNILRFPQTKNIVDKHVLLIDGVGDTFFTIISLYEQKLQGFAASCDVALLANKTKAPGRLPLPYGLELKYTAFQFGKPWLVGGSADHDQRFRKLTILAELVGAK